MCPGRSKSEIGNMRRGQLSTALYLKLLVSNSIAVIKVKFSNRSSTYQIFKKNNFTQVVLLSRAEIHEKRLQILVEKTKGTRFLGIL
jgi:hypothetical protein